MTKLLARSSLLQIILIIHYILEGRWGLYYRRLKRTLSYLRSMLEIYYHLARGIC